MALIIKNSVLQAQTFSDFVRHQGASAIGAHIFLRKPLETSHGTRVLWMKDCKQTNKYNKIKRQMKGFD